MPGRGVVHAAGLCLFGYLSYPFQAVLERLGWDTRTTVPSAKCLNELGMQFLAAGMGK